MTNETYWELCEAVQVVSAATMQHHADPSFLEEWQKWARVFVSGLYYSKTAFRAANSALAEADLWVLEQPFMSRIARAAALAATAVVLAAKKDDATARQQAAAAKNLINDIASRGGSSDNKSWDRPRPAPIKEMPAGRLGFARPPR